MKCRRCGTELRADALYCHECGQSKDGPLKCPKCGTELQESQRFCPTCGININQEITNTQKIEIPKTFINDYDFEENNQTNIANQNEYLSEDTRSFINKNKYKLIMVLLFIIQMILFGGNLIETSVSGYGQGIAEAHKLSDIIKYPTTLFYCCNAVAIIIICIDMFKRELLPNIIYKLPLLLNFVYPIVCVINFINMDDTTSSIMNMSAFGVDVSTYPTVQGVILIVSIIVITILSIIDSKNK